MSDVDETMNRYRNRYSRKNGTGTMKSKVDEKYKRTTMSEDEDEAPVESYIERRDQNIKISNLLKK